MIPLARDSVPMMVYRRRVEEGDGDAIEVWDRTDARAFVSSYPISSARMQTDDGQYPEDLHKLMLNLPNGVSVGTGDRLGDAVGPVWHLVEVKRSGGTSHLSCTARRL